MTPQRAYNLGVENGRLCKEYSEPDETIEDADWRNAAPDEAMADDALLEQFVKGCRDGWQQGKQEEHCEGCGAKQGQDHSRGCRHN